MAKKSKTKEDGFRAWEKKIAKKLDFLIVGVFLVIFTAAAVNEALESKGMTLRGFLVEKKRK